MVNVTAYQILIYGSPQGYQTNRSQVVLYDVNKVVAYVRFNDPGMVFEDDSEENGIIKMHLPSTMFQSVIDILRNEKPLNVYFAQGRGFFGTGSIEQVGEAEK
jgi:hypothetical protein